LAQNIPPDGFELGLDINKIGEVGHQALRDDETNNPHFYVEL